MKKRYTFKEVKEAATLAGYKLTAPMYSKSGKCEIEVMESFTAPVPVISEVSKLTDVMEFITSYPAVKATEVIAEEVAETNVTSEVEPVESLEDIKVGAEETELIDSLCMYHNGISIHTDEAHQEFDPSAVDLKILPSLPLNEKSALPAQGCIYFVLDSLGYVHYVGQTINLRERWRDHHKYNHINKDEGIRIAYLLVSTPSLLPVIERALIKYFYPPLNCNASGSLSEVPVKAGCATTRWHYKYKYKVGGNFVTHCLHVPKYLVEIVKEYIEQSAPVIRILEILGKVGDLRMPMQRHLYPKNWDAIAFAVKESANWKCVCCGKPCRRPKESLDAFYSRLENTPYGAHVPLAQAKPGAYVLTVAHLNHKPSDCGIENLRAYCSVCHLNYDKKHHAASRKANQIKKSVQI